MIRRSMTVTALLLASMIIGCTVKHTANPVPDMALVSKEMCIIDNPDVNESFLPAYQSALERKGFSVRILHPRSGVDACPLSSTFVGRWSWDFTPYMAYGEIVVYQNGSRVGDALYKAPRAGMAMTFKIYDPTEEKVGVMVDQLFPSAGGSY